MAHDPTRSWPTGKGPYDTSIPGAAWLEMLDGQAFPVVGAGAMVWNGTMWVPVSTQNRLPVDAAVSGTVDVSDRADRQLGKVALTGQLPALHAIDPETGNPVPVQAVRDDAGNWVLGIVDRAPYAYDPVADATRVVLPTLVSGVYTRTNVPVEASSSWSTDIIESGEAQRIRLTTFVAQLFLPDFLDLNLEWYADADGQWMIVREVTGEPGDREIKFENIKPIRGNAGIGIATVKGPYFRFTFFNNHESAPYTINRLAIHKFLDG